MTRQAGESDIDYMCRDAESYFAEARERALPEAKRYVEQRLAQKRAARRPAFKVPPLVRGFLNPHDAAHLVVCMTTCTALHIVLEKVL